MTGRTQVKSKNNILNHFNDHEIRNKALKDVMKIVFSISMVKFSGSDQNISEIISGVSNIKAFVKCILQESLYS